MQWRKANGDFGAYTGPLVDLGQGIPRRMRDHGIRRALFDLAFGYVSGFPVRDIIPFALRSLFPQPILTVDLADIAEPVDESYVGTVYVQCPACDELMPARVTAEIGNPEGADVGESTLICTPDMTDIHAHVWTHTD